MRFTTLLFAALVATVAIACGGSPTQPTTVATVSVATQTGEPTPTPPPSPPPAPTPGPAPTPPGPAPERWQGTATISSAHWYQTPALPDSFNVQLNRETITFGTLTTAVLMWEEKNATLGVFARPSGMNLQIVLDATTGRGTWTLSGEPGQATGTLAVEK